MFTVHDMNSWRVEHILYMDNLYNLYMDKTPTSPLQKKLILLKENCILPKTCISCSLSMLWKGKSKLYVLIACIMAFIFQKLQCIKACSVRTRRNHSSFFLNDDIRIICCTFSYLTMYNSELKSFVAHSYYFFTRLKKMWQIFFWRAVYWVISGEAFRKQISLYARFFTSVTCKVIFWFVHIAIIVLINFLDHDFDLYCMKFPCKYKRHFI